MVTKQKIWTDQRTLVLLQVLDQNKCKPDTWRDERQRVCEIATNEVRSTFSADEIAANSKQVMSRYEKVWSKYKAPFHRSIGDFWQGGRGTLDAGKLPESLQLKKSTLPNFAAGNSAPPGSTSNGPEEAAITYLTTGVVPPLTHKDDIAKFAAYLLDDGLPSPQLPAKTQGHMRDLSDDIQVLVSNYLRDARIDSYQEFFFRHDSGNSDLFELFEIVIGKEGDQLVSHGARILRCQQQEKAFGVETIMRSLIAAALTNWVFKRDIAPPSTKYQEIVFAILEKVSPAFRRVVTHQALIHYLETHIKPKIESTSDILAENLATALLPLTKGRPQLGPGLLPSFNGSSFAPWIENLRTELVDLFQKAFKIKVELIKTAGSFVFEFPTAGSEYDSSKMQLRPPVSNRFHKAKPKNITVGLTPVVLAAYRLHPEGEFGSSHVVALAEVFA